ncbi:MAG: YraN family protein [Desulfobacteraceae bacterium IS3]|nr:MAG: YraN family protein [Desulfobacteraceae bacterium IS3]
MSDPRQKFGKECEFAALRYLEKNGCRISEQNYRTPQGEIDIIAEQGDTIVFAEVKARKSERFGPPKSAVTPEKQRKMSMAALQYLKDRNIRNRKARFDVITLFFPAKENKPHIEWVRNAFELCL